MSDEFKRDVDELKNDLSDTASSARKAASNAAKKASNDANDAAQNLKNDLTDKAQDVKKKVENAAEDLRQEFSGAQQTFESFTEELTVTGGQLVERLQDLIKEGNIRRVILKDGNTGRVLLEIPLTLGVVAGAGVLFFINPFLAAVGAIAALVAKIQVVVERYENPADADREKINSVIDVDLDK